MNCEGNQNGTEQGLPIQLLPLLFAALMAVLMLYAGNHAGAETITVDDSGEADYTTITGALEAARDGDTISVRDGIYEEDVVVTKTVTIMGNGTSSTTVQSESSGFPFSIYAKDVTISGFRIVGGRVGIGIYNESSSISGNLMDEQSGSAILIRRTTAAYIHDNAMIGSGIAMEGVTGEDWSSHDIDSSNAVNGKPVRFYKNVTGEVISGIQAGQVIMIGCSDMKVSNLTITNSSYGMLIVNSLRNTIEYNRCSGNSMGGIYLYGSDENKLENNICENNGGGYGYDNSGISLVDCDKNELGDNICQNNSGSGIRLVSRSGYNTLTDNTVRGNGGQGIDLKGFRNVLENCIMSNNRNGLRIDGDKNDITDCTFANNSDSGIFISYSEKNSIENCRFIDNERYGIRLDYNYCDDDNNKLEDNYFSGNGQGDKHIERDPQGPFGFPCEDDIINTIITCGVCMGLIIVVIVVGVFARGHMGNKARNRQRPVFHPPQNFRPFQPPVHPQHPYMPHIPHFPGHGHEQEQGEEEKGEFGEMHAPEAEDESPRGNE